jgi:hypothetical protein
MGIISEYKNCFQFLTFNQTPPKKLLIELLKKPCQQDDCAKMIFHFFNVDGTISDACLKIIFLI